MIEAAEQRKAADRRRLAQIVAFAVNKPDELDKVAPTPGSRPAASAPAPAVPRQAFSDDQWW